MSKTQLNALITGGASGIGAAVASAWIADWGNVAILDRDADQLSRTVDTLGSDRAFGFVTDVLDLDLVNNSVESSAKALGGKIDVVVNCAGIGTETSASEGSDADWQRMLALHLGGSMRVARAAYRYLSESEHASIVNISSVAAQLGIPRLTHYAAAKSGIEGLTRTLAVEWSPKIRVNAVAPGYTLTPLVAALVNDGTIDTGPAIARTPLGRFAEPREIADVICFLASPKASFVTGVTVRVDGGLCIGGDLFK